MALSVQWDVTAARRVRDAYEGRVPGGVFGVTNTTPEEGTFSGIPDELSRVLLITQTVSINYRRDAYRLWNWARLLYEDSGARWVFSPGAVVHRCRDDLRSTLQVKGRLRFPQKDAQWWFENSAIWANSYQSDPKRLFEHAGWNVRAIAGEVRDHGFRGLGGRKIFPLWLRMLADIEGYQFENFESLRIPVDIHVARATFATHVMTGRHKGPFDSRLKDQIISAWRDACRHAGDVPIFFDEALWQLSRLGCAQRHENGNPDCPKRAQCPIGETCPEGTICVSSNSVEINT